MKPDLLLAELETAAERRAVKVSYEALHAASSGGGLCRVKGQYRVILDKRASTGERIAALASALAQLGAEDPALSRPARDLIARFVVRRAS